MRRDNWTHTLKVVLWTVLATVCVLLVGLLIVPFTGVLAVAAAESDPALHWYLETTRENTISHEAESIQPPADLTSPRRIDRGLVAYHQMCVMCHGAPGVEAGWIAQGLNPAPPRLADPAERELGDATAARDFWVIKNGIRMTGMAALEPTHGEQEMWDLVAFLQHLPKMTPEAYASSLEAAGLTSSSGSGHHHQNDPTEGADGEHDHGGDDHAHGS